MLCDGVKGLGGGFVCMVRVMVIVEIVFIVVLLVGVGMFVCVVDSVLL